MHQPQHVLSGWLGEWFVCAMQVLVGDLFLSRTTHKNITNALASTVHFIVNAVAASLVAILVQRVRVLP